MKALFFLLSFLSSLALSLDINDKIITLRSATDFIELSNNVNNGTSYAGSTVILGNDIDFTGYSEEFKPIGREFDISLCAKFDGQGHTISNLNMVSSDPFVGLFGVINGSSFKNLVVDSSCSFYNNHNIINNISYTGGK